MGSINFFKKTIKLIGAKKIFFLTFLSIIRAFAEMASIGLLIPIVGVLANGNQNLNSYNFLILNNISQEKLIFYFIFLFLLVYLIKTVYIVFYNLYVAKFSHNLNILVSENLLKAYLNKGFSFFNEINSSKIIRNITGEANLFAIGIIGSLIIIFSNFLLFFSITVLIISVNKYSILVILSLVILSYLIVKFNNKKFISWGEVRFKENNLILKSLNELLGGIKEVYLYQKSGFYIESFKRHIENLARASIFKDTYLAISAPLIEFFGLLFFFTFLIFLIVFQSINYNEIVIMFGVFAFASIKILPNIVQIVRACQNLKYNMPAGKIVIKNLAKKRSSKTFQKKIISNFKSLQLKNVKFKYDNKKDIFNKLNLKITAGEKIAIIGESGSGKSTLINLISGLLKPTNGNIYLNNKEELYFSNLIGYVSQNVYLSDDNLMKNISLDNKINDKDYKTILDIIKNLKLQNINVKKVLGERGSKLSGGQIQRVGIARCLFRNPEIIILDEATSALDSKTENKVIDYIFSKCVNKTVIFCTHKKSFIKKFDKVLEIKNKDLKQRK